MDINKNLISRNHTAKKRTKKDILWIVIHYVGALGGAYDNTQYYKTTDAGASADWFVGHAGEVWQANDYYNFYSWHCGGGRQGSGGGVYLGKCTNANSVGIEMCVRKHSAKTMNATDKDWYFEDATVKAAAELVAYLMKELDIDIDHVIRHYDVNGKICPNPFVYDEAAWRSFKAKVLALAAKESAAKSDQPTTDKIWTGWMKRESGKDGFRQTNGDHGHAYGKYQFDYRYALVPFLQMCVDYNPGRYAGFKTFISHGAGASKLVNNSFLAEQWLFACEHYPEEFEALQDRYAYQAYYLEAKKYMKNLHDIDMDSHSPALKGTLWSMAIRSGALSAARKFAGCKDSASDAEMMRIAYGTYGTEDAGRWTKAGQYGDALKTLETGEYTLIVVNGDIPDGSAAEDWYRVGTAWKRLEGKCIGQAGAFRELPNAKICANIKMGEEKKTYYVFDPKGIAVYTAEYKSRKQYTVQAGAFKVEKNAENLAAKIRAAGFDAAALVRGSDFVVQCGVFEIKKNAKNLAAELEKAGFEVVVK